MHERALHPGWIIHATSAENCCQLISLIQGRSDHVHDLSTSRIGCVQTHTRRHGQQPGYLASAYYVTVSPVTWRPLSVALPSREAAVDGAMAWRGPVETMGRSDAEFNVVLRAAYRVGVHMVELHNSMIYLHLATGAAELGSNSAAGCAMPCCESQTLQGGGTQT